MPDLLFEVGLTKTWRGATIDPQIMFQVNSLLNERQRSLRILFPYLNICSIEHFSIIGKCNHSLAQDTAVTVLDQ